VYQSTLGWRVINKKKKGGPGNPARPSGGPGFDDENRVVRTSFSGLIPDQRHQRTQHMRRGYRVSRRTWKSGEAFRRARFRTAMATWITLELRV